MGIWKEKFKRGKVSNTATPVKISGSPHPVLILKDDTWVNTTSGKKHHNLDAAFRELYHLSGLRTFRINRTQDKVFLVFSDGTAYTNDGS